LHASRTGIARRTIHTVGTRQTRRALHTGRAGLPAQLLRVGHTRAAERFHLLTQLHCGLHSLIGTLALGLGLLVERLRREAHAR
jgi:hypothetical protein